MNKFSILWDTKIKQLANKCVDWSFIELLKKGESGEIIPEEEIICQELSKNIKDPYGMWYISNMIWRVEHALADNRIPMAELAVTEIYNVITRESYKKNIFHNDLCSEEAINIKNLKSGLAELINI